MKDTAQGRYAAQYLSRICHSGPVTADLATLRELTRLHVGTIAFENATSFAGFPSASGAIDLDVAKVVEKVLSGRRGGYCFEHATLLHSVLTELGFSVHFALGRVFPDGQHPTAKTHTVVVVTLDSHAYIVDPGFGGLTPTAPLDLALLGAVQPTPHGNYRVVTLEDAGVNTALAPDVDVMIQAELTTADGAVWKNLYALDLRGIAAIDLRALNWFISTSPDSLFTQSFAVALAPEGKRVTISGRSVRERSQTSATVDDIENPTALADALASANVVLPASVFDAVAARLNLAVTQKIALSS